MSKLYGALLRAIFVALTALVAFGTAKEAQAQGGRNCRDEGVITICGDEFRDFTFDLGIDGYQLIGNITIAPKGKAPTIRVNDAKALPSDHQYKRATFEHVADLGKSPWRAKNVLFGDISFIADPRQRVPFSTGAANLNGSVFAGVFWVDEGDGTIGTPVDVGFGTPSAYPTGLFAKKAILYNQAYLDDLALSAMYAEDATHEDRSKFYAEYDVANESFFVEMEIPRLRLFEHAENPELPIAMRITMDKEGKYSGSATGFKMKMAGMTGEAKGIVVREGEFEAASLEFSRGDNPNMPNLDPSNPSLVFKLEGVKYKDGHFAAGASVGIKDWQVGNAFKLTKQSFGLLVDDVLKTTTIIISSTLTFPGGSALTDTRQYPMSIRIGAQKLGEGFYTFGKGTILNNNAPNLSLGPLLFGLPASTSLNIDSRKNFMGLEVDKVTLTWAGAFGGQSGVQSSFRLGIDKERNLVFSVNGGTLNAPGIRTGALLTTLSGTVLAVDNTTTVTLKGKAKINIPGNSSVAPTAEMILRGGKGVCGFPACKKAYELKLSAFELKIAGFTLGLTDPRGTSDGGFAVNQATLKVPAGINSISGKVQGLTITSKGDVSVTGGAFELPPLQIGKVSFVGVKGSFLKSGTGGYEFRGAGVMPLPGLDPSGGASGKKITVDLAVRTTNTGNFSGMGVKVEFNTGVPGIPIGGTGMELLAISGSFDLNNNTAKIGVAMRAGTVAKVGPLPIATIKAKADLQINPFVFTANGDLSLLIFEVANASLGVGAGQGFNGGSGFNVVFDVNAVVIHGHTLLRVGQVTLKDGSKETRIAAESSWALGIKKGQFGRFLPPRNLFLEEVRFKGGHFRLKNGTETVGLMATVGCCIFFDATVFADLSDGVDVSFVNAKDYKLIDSAQVRAQAAAQTGGVLSQQVSAASIFDAQQLVATSLVSDAMVLQEIIPIEVEQRGAALFGIGYPAGEPLLRLQLPDGTVLTEQTVDNVNSGFIRNTGTVTEDHEIAFMLNLVESGFYTLTIDNAPAEYELVSYVLNHAPVLTDVVASCDNTPVDGVVVTCNGVAAGSQISVTWNASDDDSPEAKVRVSYSQVLTDGVSLDGTNQTVIVDQLPLGTGGATWELGDISTGSYKVVVSVEDGEHAPVEIIPNVVINVTDQRAPAVPSGLQAQPLPGELLVTWTPNTEKDVAGYEIGFGVVEPGQADDPSRFVYTRDMGAKEVELPTGDVLDAKLWGLTDNQQVFVGIRAYDRSGNFSAWSSLLQATPWPLSPAAWTPIPGGLGGLNTSIEIVFDSALVSETLPSALEVRADDGTLIPGVQEPILNIDGEQVIGMRFRPTTPLTEGALYTVVVKGGEAGIASTDGRRIPEDYTWTFIASATQGKVQAFLPSLSR